MKEDRIPCRKKVKVLYYTPFYSGNCYDMFARMHDLWHYMNRERDDYFYYKILGASSDSTDSNKVYVPFKCLSKHLHKSKTYKKIIQKTVMQKILMEKNYDVFHPIHFDKCSIELIKLVKKKKGSDVKVVMGPNIMGYLEGRKGDIFNLDKASVYRKRQYEEEYALKKKYLNSKYIDGIWAIGEYHEKLLRKAGVPKEKIFLLPPAVDPKYFSNKSNKNEEKNNVFKILYLGDFTKFKGIDVFLKSLELIKKETDILFKGILVGKGPYPIEKHKSIKDDIQMVGFVDRSSVQKYYNQADVFVHPSIEEMGPTTIIEALACGTSCIATDRLAFREYDLDNVCMFFKERNPLELKEKLVNLYNKRNNDIKSDKYLLSEDYIRTLYETYTELFE